MADVTNIKTISNSLLYPVTVRDGENAELVFSIAAGGTWDGNIWVPWVGNDGEMHKCIVLESKDAHLHLRVFQDYWNPAWRDAVKVATPGENYETATQVPGNNQGGGVKTLAILGNKTLSMS